MPHSTANPPRWAVYADFSPEIRTNDPIGLRSHPKPAVADIMGTDSIPEHPDQSGNQEQEFFSRADPRIDTKGVRCSVDDSLVRVADLTGQGMRLTLPPSKLPSVGDTQVFTFTDKANDHTLTIQGIVRWVRKGSVLTRKAEVGIEFIDLPLSQRDALTRLAIQGELHLSNNPGDESAEEEASRPSVNLYDILGVSPYASDETINLAFRKLVKKWHPDRNEDPQAPARFEELHKAFSILRDPTLRQRYDDRFGPDQAAA